MVEPATQRSPDAEPSPRRVLFIAGRLEPTAPCRALIALACELGKSGEHVEMVCRSGSLGTVYPREGAARSGEHHPPIWLSRALARNPRGYFSLRGLVTRAREMDPDIIHVHGAELAGVAARLARRLRKPYILAVGDFLDPGQSISRSRRFLKKVVVASDAVRVDLVNRIRLPRELIQVVPDGVDVTQYPARERGAWQGRVPVVGTIGRLVESKGQEYFIRAAHLLVMRGRHLQFVVAGGGPDRKRLQNLVSESDLVDRLTFAREPVDQLEVLRAIDILVVPSLHEALGLPLIEGMASGIPVVATSAGGVFSLIENGKTGILVPKRDPDALANQVERLIDNPGLAAEMGERGRERVAANFNIETFADRTIAIYDDILGESPEESEAAAS